MCSRARRRAWPTSRPTTTACSALGGRERDGLVGKGFFASYNLACPQGPVPERFDPAGRFSLSTGRLWAQGRQPHSHRAQAPAHRLDHFATHHQVQPPLRRLADP
jgi:hypothetical protein